MIISVHPQQIECVPARPTIIVADDHPSIIHHVQKILCSDYEVLAIAYNGRHALQIIRQFTPDFAIMDISMPELDGLGVARELLKAPCKTRIIFLTVHSDQDYISAAMALGASGYVFKSRLLSDLRRAIQESLFGRTFISERVARN